MENARPQALTPKNLPVPHYGGDYRGPCPRESVEQISWFNRVRETYPDTWGLLAVHVRNEGLLQNGQLSAIKRHKLEGMVTGCVDIFIPGVPPLVMEMKRLDPTKSILSDEQSRYLVAAQKAGAYACIAFGASAAWDAFEDWLGMQPKPELV